MGENAPNIVNSNLSKKSTEEQYHLSRNTKKLKDIEAIASDSMVVEPVGDQGRSDQLVNEGVSSVENHSGHNRGPRSFKEALTNLRPYERAFDDDLDHLSTDDEELGEEASDDEEYMDEGMDFGVPRIKLPKSLLNKIRRPWKDCLIIKLLGKTVGYKLLITKVRNIWDLQGDFEAIDLGLGYFLFKFQMREDCAKVYMGGPWIVLDHYLTVRKWKHDFKPSQAKEVSTAMWSWPQKGEL
ncbi:uncharacterized protein LOC114283753 [Camellia sinensis]|uniref:uncharacterized protein LOC114283753 n=1 Tax=Camellia sinensis TaxID=4442 RepID=UPI0010357EBC|nr:uncharacterized protein LOC114283753 [Camellia sinensis]